MTSFHHVASLVLALSLAFAVVACGGSEEPASPASATHDSAKPDAGKPMDGKPMAEKPMDEESMDEESMDDEPMERRTETTGSWKREVMELPGDYPSYPNAREQTEIYETVGSARARRYETTDTPDDAYAFYVSEFDQQGWTIDDDRNLGGHRMLIVSKGSKLGSVMITPRPDGGADLIVTGVDR